MASLYKREPYWWIKLANNEKLLLEMPERFSTKIKNKRHAEVFLKEIKEKIVLANHKVKISKSPEGNLLFSDVLARYIEHKRNLGQELSVGTIKIYDLALKHFYRLLLELLVRQFLESAAWHIFAPLFSLF